MRKLADVLLEWAGCGPPGPLHNLLAAGTARTITRSVDESLHFAITDGGKPVDLTDGILWFNAKRNADTDSEAVIQKSTLNNGIQLTDAIHGRVKILIGASDTAFVPTEARFVFDMQMKIASGPVTMLSVPRNQLSIESTMVKRLKRVFRFVLGIVPFPLFLCWKWTHFVHLLWFCMIWALVDDTWREWLLIARCIDGTYRTTYPPINRIVAMVGDLTERRVTLRKESGHWQASRWFWSQIAISLGPLVWEKVKRISGFDRLSRMTGR